MEVEEVFPFIFHFEEAGGLGWLASLWVSVLLSFSSLLWARCGCVPRTFVGVLAVALAEDSGPIESFVVVVVRLDSHPSEGTLACLGGVLV